MDDSKGFIYDVTIYIENTCINLCLVSYQ
jgi:hypothetical protein